MSDLSYLETFGELLRAFRKRQGLTQQQVATGIGMHRNAIGHWELGNFLPESKGTVLELASFLHLTAPEARQFLEASFTAPAPSWGVPSPRNPFFTGRQEYLQRLHRYLTEQQPTSYALSGLGGIGKTQLALEYAYQSIRPSGGRPDYHPSPGSGFPGSEHRTLHIDTRRGDTLLAATGQAAGGIGR